MRKSIASQQLFVFAGRLGSLTLFLVALLVWPALAALADLMFWTGQVFRTGRADQASRPARPTRLAFYVKTLSAKVLRFSCDFMLGIGTPLISAMAAMAVSPKLYE